MAPKTTDLDWRPIEEMKPGQVALVFAQGWTGAIELGDLPPGCAVARRGRWRGPYDDSEGQDPVLVDVETIFVEAADYYPVTATNPVLFMPLDGLIAVAKASARPLHKERAESPPKRANGVR